MPTDLTIEAGVVLPARELRVCYARSSGPGGQRVNKVNTKVQLRWAFENSRVLDDEARQRLREANPGRVTRRGELSVECDSHASRERNLTVARERLATLIRASRVRPLKRRATRPSRASKNRRLRDKKQRSTLKATRGRCQE